MTNDARVNGCALPSPLPTPDFPDPSPNKYALGSAAKVSITCQFRLLTPFIGNLIGNPVSVSASSGISYPRGSGR